MGIQPPVYPEMLNNSTLSDLNNYSYSVFDQTTNLKIVQTKWTLEYIILAIYLGFLSIIGTVGNVPVLIVYFHRREQTASNTFIKALAAIDLLVCSILMPYTMVYELHLVKVDAICRMFEYLRHVAIMGSNLTLVAIASERYIAVCRITRKLSVKHINRGMLIIILISCLAATPSIGIFAVVTKEDVKNVKCSFNHKSVDGPFCHFTYSILGETLATIYQGALMIIFFITLFVIVIFYIIVYIVLWKKTQFRKKIGKNNPLETSVSYNSEQRSSVCEVIQKESWKYPKTRYIDVETSKTLLPVTIPETEKDMREVNQKETLKYPKTKYTDVETSKSLLPAIVAEKESDKDERNSTIKRDSSSTGDSNQKETKSKRKIKHTNPKAEGEKLRRTFHRRTAKMLFLCTVIYLATWLPFWFDIFGATSNLVLRYLFFIGNASNPIVYGIVNKQIRRSFKKLFFEFARRWIKPCTSDQELYFDSEIRRSGDS